MNDNEKDVKETLRFSERLELSNKVEDFITKNMINPNIFGVVSALSVLQLLDVDACHKFLKTDRLILRGIFTDEDGVDSI
jgi:hypothetical protein